jgi:ADP-glucose pyrophosphorylase
LDIELEETSYFREKFECLEHFANTFDFSDLQEDLMEKYKKIKTYYKEHIDLTQKMSEKFFEKNKEKILESIQ